MADPFESHRAKARVLYRRATPFRLGIVVGRAGEDLPSPYAPGSRADESYRAGIRYGRIPTKAPHPCDVPATE